MGEISTLGRGLLKRMFEAGCGDVQGDESIPFSIFRKPGERDVVHGDVRVAGSTMTCTYVLDDASLDVDDVMRLFAIAYLEVFTMHHYRKAVTTIAMRDAKSSATRTFPYADEVWLEPEWQVD